MNRILVVSLQCGVLAAKGTVLCLSLRNTPKVALGQDERLANCLTTVQLVLTYPSPL
jgi:hypothetical protein